MTLLWTEHLVGGVWRYLVSVDSEHLTGGEFLVKTTSEVVPRSDLLSQGLV